MPVSKELLLSILGLDAYNQGYNHGIIHGKMQIGSATFSLDDTSQSAKDASFYAISYNTEFGKVISYRGTDDPLSMERPFLDNDVVQNSADYYLKSIHCGS